LLVPVVYLVSGIYQGPRVIACPSGAPFGAPLNEPDPQISDNPNKLAKDKQSSLFCLAISEEENIPQTN